MTSRPHERRPRPWVKVCGVTRPEEAARAVELGADLVGVNFWSRSPRHVDPVAAREIAAAVGGRATLVGVFVNEPADRVHEIAAELALDLVQLHGDEPAAELARFAPRLVQVVRADGLEQRLFGFQARSATDLPGGDGRRGDSGVVEKLSLKGERGTDLSPENADRRGDVGALAAAGQIPENSNFEAALAQADASGPAGTARASGSFSLQQQAVDSASPDPEGDLPFGAGALAVAPALVLIDAPRDTRYGGTGTAWEWSSARAWIAACPRPVLVAGGVRPGNAAAALAASGAAGVDVASGVESAPGIKDAEKMRRLIEEVRGAGT